MKQAGQIIGKVEYREGDGPMLAIRPGPIEVETTELDATLSWSDGNTHGSTAMPLADFRRHLAKGEIRLDAVPAAADN